jgi:hypothetical protein
MLPLRATAVVHVSLLHIRYYPMLESQFKPISPQRYKYESTHGKIGKSCMHWEAT